DQTKRVLVPGLLPDAALAIERRELVVVALEVAGVLRDLGVDLLRRDAVRNVPVRPEDHVLHRIAEHGRVASLVLGADDDLHLERRFSAVERLQLKSGNVDEDVAGAERAREPAETLEIRGDLSEAVLHRQIERADRLGPEHTVD